jgi:hypothetical protein
VNHPFNPMVSKEPEQDLLDLDFNDEKKPEEE